MSKKPTTRLQDQQVEVKSLKKRAGTAQTVAGAHQTHLRMPSFYQLSQPCRQYLSLLLDQVTEESRRYQAFSVDVGYRKIQCMTIVIVLYL